MTSRSKVLRAGFIFILGQSFSKLSYFLFLPVLSGILGTEGIGRLSIADALFDFANVIITLNIISGYIRFYSQYDKEQKNRLRNTAISFSIILSMFILISVILVSLLISDSITLFKNSFAIIILIVFRSALSQLVTLMLCDYILLFEARKNVLYEVFGLLISLFGIYYLTYSLQMDIMGVYLGYIIGAATVLLLIIFKGNPHFKFEMDAPMLKNMAFFSGGLLVANFFAAVLNFSDRFFLAGFREISEIGIYSVGYKLGMIVSNLFITPFSQVFTPYKFEIWDKPDANEKLNEMFDKFSIIGITLTLIISLYSRIGITFLASFDFINAYSIVPAISISYLLFGYVMFFNIGIIIRNKTVINSIVLTLGGIINILLNILLIPPLGIYGATAATLISYIFLNILSVIVSKKYFRVRYAYAKTLKMVLIAGIVYLAYFTFSRIYDFNFYLESLVSSALLSLYLIICLMSGIFELNDIKKAIAVINKPSSE